MTEPVKSKAGRKPIGDKAMTRNERMQKTNDARRAQGVRSFLLHVEPGHLKWLEQIAASKGVVLTPVFRDVVETSLDRFGGVMERAAYLESLGAQQDLAGQFIESYLHIPLPTFEALANTPNEKSMKHLRPEETADYLEAATITNSMDAGHAITHMGVSASGHRFMLVTNCREETVLTEGL